MSKHFPTALRATVAAAAMAVAAIVPSVASAAVSGNIGVFSKYVLRGNTGSCDDANRTTPTYGACTAPENNNTAVQGGFDWTSDAGWFLGYWGSNLGYSYDKDTGVYGSNGFENDFYGGFSGKAGPMTYSIGLTQYYYINVDDSNLTEPFATLGFGPVTLGVKYLATDGFWGNQGDMYWTLAYATDLPAGFKFSGTLGYYLYEDKDSDKLCKGFGLASGCKVTLTDSDFRHLDLTLTHPIGKTGAEMGITYILGGKDRLDQDLEDTVVLSVKYPFDL